MDNGQWTIDNYEKIYFYQSAMRSNLVFHGL